MAILDDLVRHRRNNSGSAQADEESRFVLAQGASIKQLSQLFGKHPTDVSRAVVGVQPVGTRNGHPIYAVKDAAPYLCKPAGDIEEHLRRLDPKDLPARLQKEFWHGQTLRLAYEEKRGRLWSSEKVAEITGKVLGAMRTALILGPDEVEKSLGGVLSDVQRDAVQEAFDDALRRVKDEVVKVLREAKPGQDINEQSDEVSIGPAREAEFDINHGL